MSHSIRIVLGAVLLVAASTPMIGAQDGGESDEPRADARVHALIAASLRPAGPDERRIALSELTALAAAKERDLVVQLFVYSRDATTTRDAMAFGLLRAHVGVSDDAIVRALVPLLESSQASTRRAVAGFLSEFEHRSATRPPDYRAYRDLLAREHSKGRAPGAGFVRHLFETGPGVALLLFARVESPSVDAWDIGELERARRTVDEWLRRERLGLAIEGSKRAALAQLDRMRSHDDWWARAFAASVLSSHASLARESWLATLRRDERALVRAVAAPAPYQR